MTSIGIDLGTTNSAASTLIGDREEILDIEGDRTIRSVVSFEPGDDEVLVGNMAADLMERNPDVTVSSIKRHMVDDDYTVSIDDDSYEMTEYAPEEISALVLKKVLAGAEGSLGEAPDGAVITATRTSSGSPSTTSAAVPSISASSTSPTRTSSTTSSPRRANRSSAATTSTRRSPSGSPNRSKTKRASTSPTTRGRSSS